MEIVVVRFGRDGTSWFAVRRRDAKKVYGYRWSASWQGWGPFVSLPIADLVSGQVPKVPRPTEPSQTHIDVEDQKVAKRADQAKIRKDWNRRLRGGKTIPVKGLTGVEGEIVKRNGPRGYLVNWVNGNQSWQSGTYLREL